MSRVFKINKSYGVIIPKTIAVVYDICPGDLVIFHPGKDGLKLEFRRVN
jgi:bifunctional DNA-binding transcriptional regulator/antitoxin component of YhaV-PrlF toxin-antitoxin module